MCGLACGLRMFWVAINICFGLWFVHVLGDNWCRFDNVGVIISRFLWVSVKGTKVLSNRDSLIGF